VLVAAAAEAAKKNIELTSFVGFLASGELVFNRIANHLHKQAEAVIGRALQLISSGGNEFIKIVVDFGTPIGVSNCVETTPADSGKIFYAVRGNRPYTSRMIKGVEPKASSKLVVMLLKVGPAYTIVTSYVGDLAPREIADAAFAYRNRPIFASPEEANAFEAEKLADLKESAFFWAKHALVEASLSD
jgi:hypothetical protein